MANIKKNQAKERRSLQGGDTALELKHKYYKAAPQANYGYKQARKNLALQEYDKQRRSIQESMYPRGTDEHDRPNPYQKRQAFEKGKVAMKELESKGLKPFYEKLDSRAQAEYDKGEWFRDETHEFEDPSGDRGPRKVTRYNVTTLGGMKRMDELMSSTDNEFGRPLEGWEAYAYLQHGAPDTSLSEQEQSMKTAKSAASGQRQGGRTSAEAAAAESVESAGVGASPWVKKQEANTIF